METEINECETNKLNMWKKNIEIELLCEVAMMFDRVILASDVRSTSNVNINVEYQQSYSEVL